MDEKKTNFTPGPWDTAVTIGLLGWDVLSVIDSKGEPIARMAGRYNLKANARLLKAAPEMYELLEYWLKQANRGMRFQFHKWINAGLDRESLLRDKTTQKYIEKIRQTKRLIKQIKGGNHGAD